MSTKSNSADTITQTKVEPYLIFEGRCEEAINFYRTAIGAELTMQMRFNESPEAPPPGCAPADGNKILHASLCIGETTLMVSDGKGTGKPAFEGFSLSLTAPDEAEAKRLFAALSDGGKMEMPLAKSFFATLFGMAVDRFGVKWIVIVPL